MSERPEERQLPASLTPTAFLKRYWHLLLGMLVFAGIFFNWWFFYAFYDQHYAPLQPIPYSHKLHAGELGIDCQYCHFNAERGKHAGVPPVSICLGCHDPNQGAAGDGKPNVGKLLELVTSQQGDEFAYLATDDLDYEGEATTQKVGGVVHWNRIHKLPDHVYFRHEWHVKAGVACQTCHGPIEEMEVVQQFAPLSMGWCIDCHRRDNYVGGPDWDGSDETFDVGTANYDVLRARIQPDRVVPFEDRHIKGHGGGHDGHGHDTHAKHDDGHDHAHHRDLRGIHSLSEGEGYDSSVYNRLYVSFAQSQFLNSTDPEHLGKVVENDQKLQQGEGGLPRWRVPDLPSIHARFYYDYRDKDGNPVEFKELDAMLKGMSTEERNRWFKTNIRKFGSFQNAPTQCSTCHQ